MTILKENGGPYRHIFGRLPPESLKIREKKRKKRKKKEKKNLHTLSKAAADTAGM